MPRKEEFGIRLSRRAFLQHGSLFLAAGSVDLTEVFASDEQEVVRIGLVTDLHYADKPPAGSRHYRESQVKLAEAASEFEKHKPALLVELGDLIDAADSVDVEQGYLKTIDGEFKQLSDDRHYVLGNHCVDTLTKEEFLGAVEQKKSYYSFDRSGIHFIVLDSCFRNDGEPYGRKNFTWTDTNIPTAELEWLKSDLKESDKPTIVFAHQRLDVSNNHGVKNGADVRKILAESGRVKAVFQGHSHANDHNEIAGIHYCTLVAMVEGSGAENNGYSLLEIASTGDMRLNGFRKQEKYDWKT